MAALGVMASVDGCASTPVPVQPVASPETLVALAAAPRIIAVHYHDVGPEGQYKDAFVMGARRSRASRPDSSTGCECDCR